MKETLAHSWCQDQFFYYCFPQEEEQDGKEEQMGKFLQPHQYKEELQNTSPRQYPGGTKSLRYKLQGKALFD